MDETFGVFLCGCGLRSYWSGRCGACKRSRELSHWVTMDQLVADARAGVDGAKEIAIEAIEAEARWTRG